MRLPQRFLLGCLREALPRVIPDGGEQAVARAAGRLLDAQQRLVGQPRQQVQNVPGRNVTPGCHPFGRPERESAGEAGQPAEDRALGLGEQVVAPVEGRAQGLMAARRAAGSPGKDGEDVVEPLRQLGGRQNPHPRRRQLYRQRQPVQAAADLQDGGGVVVADPERGPHELRPLFEEPHRVRGGQRGSGRGPGGGLVRGQRRWQGQRRDRPAAFPLDAERLAAGREDGQRGAGRQQLFGEAGHRGRQVLAVVQHDQHGPAAHVTGYRLGGIQPRHVRHAELARYRLADDAGISGGSEFRPADAAREQAMRRVRRGQRQAGLAGAARAGQRQQPAALQQLQHVPQLAFAANQ